MGQRKTLLKSHTHPCQVKIVTMCLFPWLLFRFLRHIIILFFLVFLKGPCCLLKKVPVYRGKVTLTLTVLNQQLSTVFSSPERKDPLQRQASLLLSKLCLFICFCFFVGVFCFFFFQNLAYMTNIIWKLQIPPRRTQNSLFYTFSHHSILYETILSLFKFLI